MPTAALELLFLGTGTSHGIPVIGCDCAVCRSSDPRNRRMRASVLVRWEGATVLIDTSTDFRWQMLAHDVRRLDAVLFTHAHADHIFGLDDVRRFNDLQGEAIPCYASPETAAVLRRTFSYIFEADPPHPPGAGWPVLDLFEVTGPFELFGRSVVPVPVLHGRQRILGWRIGGLAYLTDTSAVPPESLPLLEGLDVLVVNALRRRPHPTHFSLEEALEAVARIGPRRAFLTHICHDLDHAEVSARLPEGVALAYDGLHVEL